MLWRTMFPSDFLAADDIPDGKEFTFHISAVVADELHKVNDRGGSKKERKLVIAFRELDEKAKKTNTKAKRYVPCKTVAKLIGRTYGQDTKDWVGKPITLYREILAQSFGEKNVPAIRVKIPRGKAAASEPPSEFGACGPDESDPLPPTGPSATTFGPTADEIDRAEREAIRGE